MIAYIDASKDRYGVEPICEQLRIAPSAYYAARNRPLSAAAVKDAELEVEISRVYEENFSCHGARKVWRQLLREGHRRPLQPGAPDAHAGPAGGRTGQGPPHHDSRRGGAEASGPGGPGLHRHPSEPVWVADLTYVATSSDFGYVAFIIGAFSGFIVSWQVSRSLRTDLAHDALEMAIWGRKGDPKGLVHHSDRGSQYLSIRYAERLAETGIEPSVGSFGDSYDNALAETIIGLYKTELVRRRGPCKGIDDARYETLEWVDWFNHHRLLVPIGHLPPAEFETASYRKEESREGVGLNEPSLP
jgi:putative transposase